MLDQGTVASFLKNTGLTGNPMFDTLIITSAIPFVISYVTILSTVVFKIVKVVGQFIVGTVFSKIKEKVSGKELCTIKVMQRDNLFEFFKDHIFKKEVQSDSIAKSFFEGMGSLVKNEYDYKKMSKTWKKKEQNSIDIDIDYSTESDKKFKYKHASYYHGETEIKYFKYKTFIVKISLKKTSDTSLIKIKLYNTINSKISKAESVQVLEQFFSDRFDLQQFVKYTYNINTLKFVTQFKNFVINSKSIDNTNRMYIGDGVSDDNIQHIQDTNTSFSLESRIQKLSSNTNYTNDIDLMPRKKTTNNYNRLSYFCDKYIGKNSYGDELDGGYSGYFWHEGILYLIFTRISIDGFYGTKIYIVSPKQLSQTEIKEKMNWIFNMTAENQVKKTNAAEKTNISVYKYFTENGNHKKYYWEGTAIDPRNFDTIYLPSKMKKNIVAEIENFFTKEKLYSKYQIPYKKGILFYGPPGTGKTTLVKTLAYEYQINIYTININDETVNDESIMDIINSISGDSIKILLFEDIDSAFADKEKLQNESKSVTHVMENEITTKINADKKNKTTKTEEQHKFDALIDGMAEKMGPKIVADRKFLTYSGLLNALDGVMSSQSGIITIMTTNYIEKLGSALIRPGRIDSKFELKECNSEQIYNMIRSFVEKFSEVQIKEIEGFNVKEYIPANYEVKVEQFVEKLMEGNEYSKIKPCALQFYILKYIENVDDIFDNIDELITAI